MQRILLSTKTFDIYIMWCNQPTQRSVSPQRISCYFAWKTNKKKSCIAKLSNSTHFISASYLIHVCSDSPLLVCITYAGTPEQVALPEWVSRSFDSQRVNHIKKNSTGIITLPAMKHHERNKTTRTVSAFWGCYLTGNHDWQTLKKDSHHLVSDSGFVASHCIIQSSWSFCRRQARHDGSHGHRAEWHWAVTISRTLRQTICWPLLGP